MRLEPIEPRHAEALERLFAENDRPSVTSTFDPFPLSAEHARSIALEPRRDRYYLLLEDGRPVGMSMLRGFDEGFEVPSFGVFVDHRHHGRGLGRTLTALTVEEARALGAPAVRLTVYADNLPALRLYGSLGFAVAERSAGEREKVVMMLPLAEKA